MEITYIDHWMIFDTATAKVLLLYTKGEPFIFAGS